MSHYLIVSLGYQDREPTNSAQDVCVQTGIVAPLNLANAGRNVPPHPYRGKARKGSKKMSTALRPRVPQELGGCTDRVRKYNTTAATNIATESAPSDHSSQVAVRRLIPPTPRLCSLAPSVTDTTLQHCRLPSVTRWSLLGHAAGLVPVRRASGNTSFQRRAKRGNRVLKCLMYWSAFRSITFHSPSRAFYDRKRAEGKAHHQAVIALARRRANVLWAMLRDGQPYRERPRAEAA